MTQQRNHNNATGSSSIGDLLAAIGSILAAFGKALLRDLLWMVMAFAVGTAALGAVCLYYGVPLIFSLAGGLIVLGIALALKSDSIFD